MRSLTQKLDKLTRKFRISGELRSTVFKNVHYVNLYDFGLVMGLGNPFDYVFANFLMYPESARKNAGIQVLHQQPSGFEQGIIYDWYERTSSSPATFLSSRIWIRASFAIAAMSIIKSESDLSKHLFDQLENYDCVATNSNRIEVLIPSIINTLSYRTNVQSLRLDNGSDVTVLHRQYVHYVPAFAEDEMQEEVGLRFDPDRLITRFKILGGSVVNFYRV